ncbi:NAD(+) diphosphatase [Schleiferilactobacillus shenzhenensis]|uniref:NAD(+) diphosphatase n=1 Tax=Schleiferilactobacillus shenzhenensis LY-73 TaxID=1231336 RepID=U4TT74_9LACO|nr:NUDIX domain-containing protein [Schleiferilactobacillus shenzhenensis]ERL65083.1 NAD+ diphosphatase [Schleiferilactobacillus shenzhenensis LY-73]
MKFHYCPNCGAALIDRTAGDDGPTPYCQHCQQFWFPSFSDCVIVLVANEANEIALVKMPYLSTRYAGFVSGYMKPGETAETTARREVEEELGLTLTSLRFTGTYWFGKTDTLMHGFIGLTADHELVPSKELASAQWVAATDVPDLLFPDRPENTAFSVYRAYMAR